MNKQYIRTLLDETIKGVSVIFNVNDDSDIDTQWNNLSPSEQRAAASRKTIKQNSYLYLTRLDCQPGDYLVVEAREVFKVVKVVECHDEPPITENDTIEYKWVVAKLDMLAYGFLLESETQALGKITSASRGHHRKLARTALLSSFPELANINEATNVKQI